MISSKPFFIFILTYLCLGCSTDKKNQTDTELIVIGREMDINSLNPLRDYSIESSDILNLIYPKLFMDDPNFYELSSNPRGLLVKTYKQYNQFLAIRLRNDFYWTDKKNVTSNDVEFSIQLFKNPEITHLSEHFKWVDRIEILSPDSLHILLKNENPFIFSDLNVLRILPAHQWEKYSIEDLVSFNGYSLDMVTCGPYIISEWVRNISVKLSKNEYYPIEIKNAGIELKVVPDPIVRLNEFVNHRLHYLPKISIPEAERIKTIEHKEIMETPMNATEYIILNMEKSPFDQIEFRKFLNHAIDNKEITRQVLNDYGIALHTLYPKKYWIYRQINNNVEATKLITSESLQLEELKSKYQGIAKWFDSTGGVLTIKVRNTDDVRKKAAYFIKEQMEIYGITIKIESVESQLLSKDVRSGNYDLAIWGTLEGSRPNPAIRFSSRNVNTSNLSRIKDAKLDQLIDAYQTAKTIDEAIGQLIEIERYILDQQIIIPLFERLALSAVDNRLKNISVYPANQLGNATSWFVDSK